MGSVNKKLYDLIGGRPTLNRVHKIFYDKVYAHPWMKQYFKHKSQEILEKQQSDFMSSIMGGPRIYAGRTPKLAHQHMNVSEELFELRRIMLSNSIREAGISDELRDQWLAADGKLKGSIVKASVAECKRAFHTQEILDFPKPRNVA